MCVVLLFFQQFSCTMIMYTLSSMAETDGGRRQFSLNRVPCKLYKEGHKINNILLELKFLVLEKGADKNYIYDSQYCFTIHK